MKGSFKQSERYQAAMSKLQKLEVRANHIDQLGRFSENADLEEEANNLYINSIKVKLALLNSTNH